MIAYTVITAPQDSEEGFQDSSHGLCEGERLTPGSNSERHGTPPPHVPVTPNVVENGPGTSELPEITASIASHQASNGKPLDDTSCGLLDGAPTQGPSLGLDLDVLISTLVAGPWPQAFSVEESDLQDLTGKT